MDEETDCRIGPGAAAFVVDWNVFAFWRRRPVRSERMNILPAFIYSNLGLETSDLSILDKQWMPRMPFQSITRTLASRERTKIDTRSNDKAPNTMRSLEMGSIATPMI